MVCNERISRGIEFQMAGAEQRNEREPFSLEREYSLLICICSERRRKISSRPIFITPNYFILYRSFIYLLTAAGGAFVVGYIVSNLRCVY